MAILWNQLLQALIYLHSLRIIHCDVKPENVIINPHSLHLYLFDMGLAREGWLDFNGDLVIECDGCTPAFAGPELSSLFHKMSGVVLAEERDELKKAHPIDVTGSDLWASALTILAGVCPAGERTWNQGIHGMDAVQAQRKAQISKAGRGAIQHWTHEVTMEVFRELRFKEKFKDSILNAFAAQRIDGEFLKGMKSKKDLTAVEGISIGGRTDLWKVWRPFLALPIDDKMYNAFEKCLSSQKKDRFQTANEVLQAITPLITLSPVSDLKQRASAGIQIDREDDMIRRQEMLTNIGNALLNHGYFKTASTILERVLNTQGEMPQIPTVKGVTVSKSLMQVTSSLDGCSTLCDCGIDHVLMQFRKVSGMKQWRQPEWGHIVAALSALSIGNAENARAIASRESAVFYPLALALKESIQARDAQGALTAQLTLGLCFYLSSTEDSKQQIIEHGILGLLVPALGAYGHNPFVVMNISWLTRNMSTQGNPHTRSKLCCEGTVEGLLHSIRIHHMEDDLLCAVTMNNLFNFSISTTSQEYNKLLELNIPSLLDEIEAKHVNGLNSTHLDSSLLVKAFCRKLKNRFL